ncbi:MAG: hypothetical protein ILP10_06510 [Lachnospiraceae bacterium]|nr:hypothetical protein [Lachnospiraceae bacterium]
MARKTYDDDDGRTIVSMDVDGMPDFGFRSRIVPRSKTRPKIDENGNEIPADMLNEHQEQSEPLTKREMRGAIFSATLAGLVVALVMSAGLILFTLFCTEIWF